MQLTPERHVFLLAAVLLALAAIFRAAGALLLALPLMVLIFASVCDEARER